ncbi:MAG TPA: RNA-binding protein, partial [Thermoanaerobaculia bacterium]|nr:RNA-binding protein [Thermoanaerobaculia bacterium]
MGNLNFKTTSEDLKELFGSAGTCEWATVMSDRLTGKSRGFGFVEMGTDEEAQKAVQQLNGHDFQGRNLNVNEARERTAGGGGGAGAGASAPRSGGYAGGGYAGGGGGYSPGGGG